MMYRCEGCGHLFEEGEQAVWEERHGLDTPPYEQWSGCPVCKDSYQEAYRCIDCGDWHTEDEMNDGWCEKCLRESITYDTFFEYCEANKDKNYLDVFVMSEFLDMDMPKHSSFEFHQVMTKIYKACVKETKENLRDDFLPVCIRFIMDDDGSIGRENYADWLNKREGK